MGYYVIVSHKQTKGNMSITKQLNYVYPNKLPFTLMMDGNELKTQQQEVTRTNPFSQVTVTLPRYAAMVYDKIKDAEVEQDYDTMRKGLDWFSLNFTDEYYKLLD